MLELRIICVGGLKENYFKQAVEEYTKRLSAWCNVNIIEVAEAAPAGNDPSPAEAERIARHLKGYVIVGDIGGKAYTSPQLSETINDVMSGGNSCISFVIGGSWGLNDTIKKRADLRLSFGSFTYPHQLFRVMALEQFYRVFTILNGTPYHK
ncbi:MAG: 23S rRNA (pseudouridine(1915)-N(3))-methyltransferase RlmH [Firmicutes bacterium]|nr:23S rRNA (pseudouridine(1915)-N(3))-methyltransferase RlmH [Bacillota bacterium]